MPSLEDFRKEIDQLDHTIIEALGRRYDICRDVAKFKSENDIPMMQPNRVEHVKNKAVEIGKQFKLNPDLVYNIYSLIINESCRLEDEIIEELTEKKS